MKIAVDVYGKDHANRVWRSGKASQSSNFLLQVRYLHPLLTPSLASHPTEKVEFKTWYYYGFAVYILIELSGMDLFCLCESISVLS